MTIKSIILPASMYCHVYACLFSSSITSKQTGRQEGLFHGNGRARILNLYESASNKIRQPNKVAIFPAGVKKCTLSKAFVLTVDTEGFNRQKKIQTEQCNMTYAQTKKCNSLLHRTLTPIRP